MHVITNDLFGHYGAKETSEGTTCSASSALLSAIYVAHGVWIKDFPVQPEKVLWASKGILQRTIDEEMRKLELEVLL